jgi:D-serine dehydratase
MDNALIIKDLISNKEVFWTNRGYEKFETGIAKAPLHLRDVMEAEARLQRFAPYIAKIFPETKETNGIIESPIVKIPAMQQHLEQVYQ